jgi:tRNA(Ile)-lysidine synthase TilS/MesJ
VKCKRCRCASAVIELPGSHAAFCADCFFHHFRKQVEEGIRRFRLLSPSDRVLVCVSGGKDSLVLWDILLDLGYDAEGLYIDLAIPGYSERSKERVLAYAASRGKEAIVVDLAAEGVPIPEAAKAARKEECAVCGTVKRYFFNRTASQGGFSVVATGHNLDDEAGRLLGNLLHWHRDHLSRQHPLLPEGEGGLVRKVRPLWRLGEMETAAYGFLKGIDYVTEECPMSRHATSLVHKEALALLEEAMPGTRAAFFYGFLDEDGPMRTGIGPSPGRKGARPGGAPSGGGPAHGDESTASPAADAPAPRTAGTDGEPGGEGAAGAEAPSSTCSRCGVLSWGETCSLCRLREKVELRREREAARKDGGAAVPEGGGVGKAAATGQEE